MLISRKLLKIFSNNSRHYKSPTITNIFSASFCETHTSLTSPQRLQQFKKLLQINSNQSLTDAAQMMAQLQVKVEILEEEIDQMEKQLQKCPNNTKILIQKIQKVIDNIQLQNQEIIGIEKRAQKELVDCQHYSVSNVAKQVLQTADSLHRCYKHALSIKNNDSNSQQVKSIRLLQNQLDNIFQVYGIKEFDPLGQIFDPNKQQAVAHVPLQQGKKSNTVAFTSRTGYTIKGRLLRSAHVGVFE